MDNNIYQWIGQFHSDFPVYLPVATYSSWYLVHLAAPTLRFWSVEEIVSTLCWNSNYLITPFRLITVTSHNTIVPNVLYLLDPSGRKYYNLLSSNIPCFQKQSDNPKAGRTRQRKIYYPMVVEMKPPKQRGSIYLYFHIAKFVIIFFFICINYMNSQSNYNEIVLVQT